MQKNSPPLIFKIAVSVVTIAIGLFAIEATLRLKNSAQDNYNVEMWRYAKLLKVRSKNPLLGHEHKPNSEAELEKVRIRINRLGLRGPEYDLSKKDKKRILFIGSSNTLGWGVEESNTMTSILQSELGDTAIVLNAGIGNYNALRYVTLFEEKLRNLDPDIVVVHYFVNDAEHLDAGGGNILLRNSQLALLTFYAAQSYLKGSKDMGKLIAHYRNVYREGNETLETLKVTLNKLNTMAKEDNFKIIFAMTPDSHNLDDYPFGFIHEYMKKMTSDLGWVYVDLTEDLKKYPAEKLWVMPGDPHYNALGHRTMAQTLLPYLR